MDFKSLQQKIISTHNSLQQAAVKAVNVALTLRNWLIGFYIVEYEQNGEDRAKYGEALLKRLEKDLKSSDIKNLTERRFRDYRRLYFCYPAIGQSVTAEFKKNGIGRSVTAVSHVFDKSDIFPMVLSKVFSKNEEISSEQHQTRMPPHLILTKLSYSNIW
ncbi:MAG TPA: DUF1016 family protein [Mariniphaga anaerophila]|uniref:DUF1016 family protein n=1 Tax=Mariniphaga anaerophila TaxID=1484053 RepID=A0A831PRB5_9BACT|nr:DUF1016 family protein [Mariniphaga anaerophila]